MKKNFSNAEQKVREEIFHLLRKSLGEKYKPHFFDITYPPNVSMGHFSISCFHYAKIVSQKPNEAAVILAEKINAHCGKKHQNIVIQAKNFGPYVNFFVSMPLYGELVIHEILKKKNKFGESDIGHGQKIMIEYSQPNTHKEFHVGHLRNVCIGWSLVKLYQMLGYKVISANYIGDIGAHVAKCLWAYLAFHKNDRVPKNKGKYLGEIYIEANKKIEENEDYKKEVSEILQKLESGNASLIALWKKTKKWSLDEFKKIYKRLGVDFDAYFFESEVEKDGKTFVHELLTRGIAQKSEGAVIIDLEKYELKKFLLLKSDGTSLYSTKDLALAYLKFKEYKIDKSFYVVDTRQSFYFKQLFKTLEIMGFHKEMVHISYDFVTLKEGAMSSRSGNIVLFEDFEKEVMEVASVETKKRHKEWPQKRIEKVSKSIAHAAMKYDMLLHGNNSVVIFDISRATQLNGKTGPYLQYTHARIGSILAKANTKIFSSLYATHLQSSEEQQVIFLLAQFPQVAHSAAMNFDPSLVSNYLYDLAKTFSLMYERNPVLQSEPDVRKGRLSLIYCAKTVLALGMKILGIDALEKM